MSASEKLAHAEQITGALDDLVIGAHDLSDDIGNVLTEVYAANKHGDLRGRLDEVCSVLLSVEKARKELEGSVAEAMFAAYCLADDLTDEAAEEEDRERWALLKEYWKAVI